MGTNDESLKDVFRRAAEIASVVPESMQPAAFLRAVDTLTGTTPAERGSAPVKKESGIPSEQGKTSSPSAHTPDSSPADALLAGINSTNHPEILSTNSWADRSLMVLEAALKDHNIDGLTPRRSRGYSKRSSASPPPSRPYLRPSVVPGSMWIALRKDAPTDIGLWPPGVATWLT